MATKAYSYIRFSNLHQQHGDSIARQVESRDRWIAAQKNVVLDTEFTLHDYGKSASRRGKGKKKDLDNVETPTKGTNLDPEKGNLGRFIQACSQGKIEHGSYLILDSMDRFSRDSVLDIAYLLQRLVKKYGLRIVILKPSEQILEKKNIENLNTVLQMVITISLSFEYAERLSDNIKGAWKRKRKAVHEGKELVTSNYPAWITIEEDGSFSIKPEAQAAISYLYKRVLEGVSQYQIVKELNDRYDPITKAIPKNNALNIIPKTNQWNTSYVNLLLKDRRVLGEYQMYYFNEENVQVKAGPPVENYFPRLVDEETFYKAQAAKKDIYLRNKQSKNQHIQNLFTGLIYCVCDGYSMFVQNGYNQHKGKRYPNKRLISYGRKKTKDYCKITLDYNNFERLMITLLLELSKTEIQSPGNQNKQIESMRLAMSGKEEKLRQVNESLENDEFTDDVPYLLRLKRNLEKSINQNREELEYLSSVELKTSEDVKKDLRKLRKDLTKEENRYATLKLIRSLVYRIFVYPVKISKGKSGAAGVVLLRTGQPRKFVLVANNIAKPTWVTNTKGRPSYVLTKEGAVIWLTKHEDNQYKLASGVENWFEYVKMLTKEVMQGIDWKGESPFKENLWDRHIVPQTFLQQHIGYDSLVDLSRDLRKGINQ